MNKALNILAVLTNAALLLGFVILVSTQNVHPRGVEYLILLLVFAVPALNLWALASLPDREERRLARDVRKAELRQRLQQLAEGKACVCGCGSNCKCGCGTK